MVRLQIHNGSRFSTSGPISPIPYQHMITNVIFSSTLTFDHPNTLSSRISLIIMGKGVRGYKKLSSLIFDMATVTCETRPKLCQGTLCLARQTSGTPIKLTIPSTILIKAK